MFKKKSYGNDKIPFLVVGLGNPGKQYDNTRHNIGFDAIDLLAKEENVQINKSKFNSLYAQINFADQKLVLLKPQTYMNLSGRAVEAVTQFYKIPPENVIVLFDDISLPPGKVRVRQKGSHGGHNGIRDIIDWLQTDQFMRIKIGVGEKPNPNYDLADWVLSRFTSAERKEVDNAIALCPNIVKLLVQGKVQQAMSDYNGL